MTACRERLLAAALCGLAMLAPRAGWAWGGEAHRVVALIADRLLAKEAPAVRAKVQQILASDTANELTKTDIASESTWADILLEKSPEARTATSEWHYARLDFAQPDLNKDCFGRPSLPAGYPASHGPRDNCIVDKVEQFSRELREPGTSEYERLAALQFLLNLVGDLHQPLYVIDHKDQHGECVALQLPRERKPLRLSRYWDDILVADALGKDPEAAADRLVAALAPTDIAKWSSLGPEAWVQESYAVARSTVYAWPADAAAGTYTFPATSGEKDPCGPVKLYRLDAAYQRRAVATVRVQLAKAGVRLAYLLREDLR
jgi:hypothetical protein